ncbi:MAG TPA: YitT family protein [Bacilli bacterium]
MSTLLKVVAVFIGSLFIAAGINFYLLPFKVLDGGILGIALILHYLLGAEVSLMIMMCSLPIFVIAWFHDQHYVYGSLLGLLLSSLFIHMLGPYQYHFLYYIELSPVSSSILGGFFIGTGLGVMLRYHSSTGGTDLLAHFISKFIPVNVGFIIFIIDAIVISVGGLLLSEETFFLSLLTIAAGGIATSLCIMKST